MNQTIWSQEYSSYVSYTFLPEKERKITKKVIKFDITKCVIKVSCFGFYELWLQDKKIKSINFDEYLAYRKYVKEILREVDYE